MTLKTFQAAEDRLMDSLETLPVTPRVFWTANTVELHFLPEGQQHATAKTRAVRLPRFPRNEDMLRAMADAGANIAATYAKAAA